MGVHKYMPRRMATYAYMYTIFGETRGFVLLPFWHRGIERDRASIESFVFSDVEVGLANPGTLIQDIITDRAHSLVLQAKGSLPYVGRALR